jgi:outer membrane protein OmpA-like peptidoglycan-associated protein
VISRHVQNRKEVFMQASFFSRRWAMLKLATGSLLLLTGQIAFAANDDDAAAPVVPSGEILKSLSKDIVLDAPSRPGARRPAGANRGGLSLKVHFAFGSAQLLTQGQRQLDQLAAALTHQDMTSYAFELAGHTDAVGSHASNMRLSLERANAAKAYLVQTHGLSPERLLPIGFGFTRLANPGDPTSGANRRVEVRRLRLSGVVPQVGAMVVPTPSDQGGALVITPKTSTDLPGR